MVAASITLISMARNKLKCRSGRAIASFFCSAPNQIKCAGKLSRNILAWPALPTLLANTPEVIAPNVYAMPLEELLQSPTSQIARQVMSLITIQCQASPVRHLYMHALPN